MWGAMCFALTVTVDIVPQLPSIARDPVLRLFGRLFFVCVAGGAERAIGDAHDRAVGAVELAQGRRVAALELTVESSGLII